MPSAASFPFTAAPVKGPAPFHSTRRFYAFQALPVARGYVRDSGFTRVWRELYTCCGRRLGLEAIALWVFLRDHVNRENGLAWPGYRSMQATFGISNRRILTALIGTLQSAGLVEAQPAAQAIPGADQRRNLSIDGRGVVYVVHDPSTAAEFAQMTLGCECHDCPRRHKCKDGQQAIKEQGNGSAPDAQPLPPPRYKPDARSLPE